MPFRSFEQSLPIDGVFKGVKPPTTDEVLTNYLFHHKVLQEETKRQSSTRDAAVKTAEALIMVGVMCWYPMQVIS